MRMNHIRTEVFDNVLESFDARPEHCWSTIEEIDLRIGNAGAPELVNITRPVLETFASTAGDNVQIVTGRLQAGSEADDCFSCAAPHEWSDNQNSHDYITFVGSLGNFQADR